MRGGSVKACYEAGVSGYDRYRRLTALGVTCDVIAPALTPRRPGQRAFEASLFVLEQALVRQAELDNE